MKQGSERQQRNRRQQGSERDAGRECLSEPGQVLWLAAGRHEHVDPPSRPVQQRGHDVGRRPRPGTLGVLVPGHGARRRWVPRGARRARSPRATTKARASASSASASASQAAVREASAESGGRILRLEPPLRSRLGALHERVHSRAPGHVEDCLALHCCVAGGAAWAGHV